ncbi:acyltransferase family protein [Cedecea neteri]|uniref:acyltransferase family protein n=1 Tax=Cedecea neteri TaxID=158822 RepID=UPI002893292E|nr:acyltransferase family protein [Cedecea neteri]WNJ81466.1 acyltransferase family protein [Cedecea neteri]
MQNEIKTQRNSTIDTAKGFLMLCVVAGHIAGWSYDSVYILYYFHLQTFFFISGYLFNYQKYKFKPILLVRSRVSLYMKYFSYMVAFVVDHNLLTKCGFNGQGSSLYSWTEYFSALTNSLVVPSEPLTAAMWFIPALLAMQVIFYASRTISDLIGLNISFDSIVVLTLFFIGFYFLNQKVYTTLDYRYVTFLPFFYAGYLMRGVKTPRVNPFYSLSLSLIVLIYAHIYGVNMNNYYGINPFELLSVSLFGVVFCISISDIISKYRISKVFEYIGERTIHILALHFISFKAATIILVYIGLVDKSKIYDLGGGVDGSPYIGIVYLISGVAIPCALMMAYDFIKSKKTSNDVPAS